MSNLQNLRTLLIEPNSGMRASLHTMLKICGITKIDHALNSNTAIRAVQSNTYDLILCEYDLGIGQDGQQLLEDIRHHKLIPLSTIFIMLTAERAYSKVISAVELAPNDYLLKPFNSDQLLERVIRAVEKRQAFIPIYTLIEQDDLREAIQSVQASEEIFPKYAIDFKRIRAELHVSLGEAKEAESLYQEIYQLKTVAWARLGLAKTLYMQGSHEESSGIFKELVNSNYQYMDAYDWLSKSLEALGDFSGAQSVLNSAIAVSPHAVRRLRKLGALTLDNGDIDNAEPILKKVIQKAKYSEFKDPEDHVNLVNALVSKGDHSQAQTIIRDLEKNMPSQTKTEACRAISAVMLYTATKDERLTAELEAAMHANRQDAGLSNDIKLKFARSCLDNNLDDSASELLQEVMSNASNSFAIKKALSVFDSYGKGHLGSEILERSKKEVTELLALGAKKAKENDFKGSLELMNKAAHKSPDNAQVVLNAALAALKYIENLGWDKQTAATAKEYINSATRLDPMNSRLKSIRTMYEKLQLQYGISTKSRSTF